MQKVVEPQVSGLGFVDGHARHSFAIRFLFRRIDAVCLRVDARLWTFF